MRGSMGSGEELLQGSLERRKITPTLPRCHLELDEGHQGASVCHSTVLQPVRQPSLSRRRGKLANSHPLSAAACWQSSEKTCEEISTEVPSSCHYSEGEGMAQGPIHSLRKEAFLKEVLRHSQRQGVILRVNFSGFSLSFYPRCPKWQNFLLFF